MRRRARLFAPRFRSEFRIGFTSSRTRLATRRSFRRCSPSTRLRASRSPRSFSRQATEFEQIGQAQPLLVFEHEFTIGVRFEVVATVPAGRMDVPGTPPLSGVRRPTLLRTGHDRRSLDADGGQGRRRASDRATPRSLARSRLEPAARRELLPIAAPVRPVNSRRWRTRPAGSVLRRSQHRRLHRHRRFPAVHSKRGIRRQRAGSLRRPRALSPFCFSCCSAAWR